jgi:hypothetical protein
MPGSPAWRSGAGQVNEILTTMLLASFPRAASFFSRADWHRQVWKLARLEIKLSDENPSLDDKKYKQRGR